MQKVTSPPRHGQRRSFGLFSVDPERDTPESIESTSTNAHLSKQMELPHRRYVDGKKRRRSGLKLPMEKEEGADERTAFDITHGSRFVLVDPDHRIRGYYEMTGKEATE